MDSLFNVVEIARKRRIHPRAMRPIKSNISIEAEYYGILREIVSEIRKRFTNLAVETMSRPRTKEQWQDAAPYDKTLDKVVDKIIEQIRKKYHSKRLELLIKKMFLKADKYQSAKFRRAVEYGFGFKIDDLPEFKAYKPFINSVIKKNLEIIENLRDDTLYKTSLALRTAVAQGSSIKQVQTAIMSTGEVGKKRAALIARTEIKNVVSALNEKRAISAGFSTYIWLTANDERVRGNPSGKYPANKSINRHDNHYIMNGLLCRYGNDNVYSSDGGKTWQKRTSKMPLTFPGQAIMCRCVDFAQN